MKLNFWQWLGLLLLLVGVAMWIYKRSRAPASTRLDSPTGQVDPLGRGLA